MTAKDGNAYPLVIDRERFLGEAKPDAVNHPSHYTRGGIEAIDAIEAWDLDFNVGNAVKYLARAGHKDPAKEIEDLEKARWYVERAIARRKASRP